MSKVFIKFKKGFKIGEVLSFTIEKGGYIFIGNDAACEVYLNCNDTSISKLHCSITFDGFGYYLFKNDSNYKTQVNNKSFINVIKLSSNDKITIGVNGVEFIFDSDPKSEKLYTPQKQKQSLLSKIFKGNR